MPIEIPNTDHTNSFDFWLNILLQIIIVNWMGVFLFTYSLAFVIIVTHVLLQAQVIQKILINVGEWEERVYVRKLQDFFGSCTDEHQFNINNKVLMRSGTSSEAKVSKMSSKIKPIGNEKTLNVLKGLRNWIYCMNFCATELIMSILKNRHTCWKLLLTCMSD